MGDEKAPIRVDLDALFLQQGDEEAGVKLEVAEERKEDWVVARERLVRQALEEGDHDQLRTISALPGGFGTEDLRQKVWPVLLSTELFFPANGGPSHDTKADSASPQVPVMQGEEGGMDTITQTAASAEHEEVGHPETSPASSDGKEILDTGGQSSRPNIESLAPHKDEGQVLLDTKRSFVTYPKGLAIETKLQMQDDLHSLIIHVLRLYPTLHYFQGFHDIMSVLYLTFIPLPPPSSRSRSRSTRSRDRKTPQTASSPPSRSGTSTPGSRRDGMSPLSSYTTQSPAETKAGKLSNGVPAKEVDAALQEADEGRGRRLTREEEALAIRRASRDTPEWKTLRQCAEVVSACRVRDAMGHGMEPMMGLLKVLQRLLKAADPDLQAFSSTISPIPTLPFFALSWILCLFSHDVDEVEPIQRMFDFLLARNPISAIYLAVAILISKKDQMFRLAKNAEADDDPSLLHPLFSRLPPLHPDTPGDEHAGLKKITSNTPQDDNPYDPIPLSTIFRLTDDLMARYPWDGDIIGGKDIMGEGSVVQTYAREIAARRRSRALTAAKQPKLKTESVPPSPGKSPVKGKVRQGHESPLQIDAISLWTLAAAAELVDDDVIKPGSTEPDDEGDEEERPRPVRRPRPSSRLPLHLPRNKLGTVLAIGVVLLGVGIVYGQRNGGGWKGFWNLVARSWVAKVGLQEVWTGYGQVLGWSKGTIREII